MAKGNPVPNAPKGRKKGVPNRMTVEAKRAIELAFLGLGGVDDLMKWARKNRTAFYSKVFTKVIPRNLNVSGQIQLESLVLASLGQPKPAEKPAETIQ